MDRSKSRSQNQTRAEHSLEKSLNATNHGMEWTSRTNASMEAGRAAEDLAARFLEARGYLVLARNYRWKRGEADIIFVAPDGAVVVVEVRSAKRASPWLKQSVNHAKVRHLLQTLDVFLARYPSLASRPRRLELVWVVAGVVEHWPQPL